MWEKALLAQAEPLVPLTLTDKCNMQHIYESKQTRLNFKYTSKLAFVMYGNYQNNLTDFTNRKLRLKTTEEIVDDPFEPTWKQSLSMLGSYIDILAPELLAVWDIPEDVPLPTTPHQKVMSWLESSTSQYTTQSQDEPEDIFTPINTQELISVSQQKDITCIDDTDVLQEILLPKVISKSIK